MKTRPKAKKHSSKTYAILLPNGKTVRYIAWEGRVWRASEESAGK
jgi:hypothetical protein